MCKPQGQSAKPSNSTPEENVAPWETLWRPRIYVSFEPNNDSKRALEIFKSDGQSEVMRLIEAVESGQREKLIDLLPSNFELDGLEYWRANYPNPTCLRLPMQNFKKCWVAEIVAGQCKAPYAYVFEVVPLLGVENIRWRIIVEEEGGHYSYTVLFRDYRRPMAFPNIIEYFRLRRVGAVLRIVPFVPSETTEYYRPNLADLARDKQKQK